MGAIKVPFNDWRTVMVATIFRITIPIAIILSATAVFGDTIRVYPPWGISEAVSASSPGDSILVMPGVYVYEIGAYVRHSLTIIGVDGPHSNEVQICTDLCTGALFFVYMTDWLTTVTIDGLTMTENTAYPGRGTAVSVVGGGHYIPRVVVRNCVFFDMYEAVYLWAGDVRIEHNLFEEAMIFVRYGTDRDIFGNTFIRSGVILDHVGTAQIANNLFLRQSGVHCGPSIPNPPSFLCNNAWESDYYGCVNPTGTDGNINVDPLACDLEAGDFRLRPGSPCLPENSPADCGLIGAFGPCGASPVNPATWGQIKAAFRDKD